MKDLIEFLNGIEPLYRDVVSGAPESKIVELEAALNRPLPVAYRDFLATAGQNLGFIIEEVNFDIDEVISLAQNRGEPIPDRFVPIASDESTSSMDYFLDLLHPAGVGDALVVRIPAGVRIDTRQTPVFYSLRDMLFSSAFDEIRMPRLAARAQLLWLPSATDEVERIPALKELDDAMKQLGFKALEVTSPAAQLYERGDCAATLYQIPFDPYVALSLGANTHRGLMDAVEKLREMLPGKAELSQVYD